MPCHAANQGIVHLDADANPTANAEDQDVRKVVAKGAPLLRVSDRQMEEIGATYI